jgi:hypothetical protein
MFKAAHNLSFNKGDFSQMNKLRTRTMRFIYKIVLLMIMTRV